MPLRLYKKHRQVLVNHRLLQSIGGFHTLICIILQTKWLNNLTGKYPFCNVMTIINVATFLQIDRYLNAEMLTLSLLVCLALYTQSFQCYSDGSDLVELCYRLTPLIPRHTFSTLQTFFFFFLKIPLRSN